MADKPKIEPIKIRIRKCRFAFTSLHEPKYRTDRNGQADKGTPEKPKKPRFQVTLLIDPSTVEGKEDIAAVKAEAARLMDHRFEGRANWPKANPATGLGAPIWCFGNGNDLPKVYDGFRDMFYIKCADTERPLLGALTGQAVRLLADGWHVCDKNNEPTEERIDQAICPYAGAFGTARISLYTYDNQSAGVNSNIISLQFKAKGGAFGGRPTADANEEFEKGYGEYVAAQQASAPDPFG